MSRQLLRHSRRRDRLAAALVGALVVTFAVGANPPAVQAAAPLIASVGDATVNERDLDTTVAVTIGLSGAPTGLVSARWSTRLLAGATAATTGDFRSASGTVFFSPTTPRTATITLTIKGDTLTDRYPGDGKEFFEVVLTGVTGALIGDPGLVTIVDDEQPRCAGMEASPSRTVAEPAVGQLVSVPISITNRGQPQFPCSVAIRYAGGTATPGVDAVVATGTFNVAFLSSATVLLDIVRDGAAEGPETVVIAITDAGDVQRVYATVTVTITDTP